MEAEHKLIPWCVGSLSEFLYYCCPECDTKSPSEKLFLSHAVSEHPLSIAYLLKFNVEQYENYEKENISPSLDIKSETSTANDEKVEIVKHELESDMVEYYSEMDCYVSIEKLKDETITRHLNGSDFVDELIQQNHNDHEFETEIKTEGESDFEYDDIGNDATDILDENHEEKEDDVQESSKQNINCSFCGLSFKKRWNMKRHKLKVHPKEYAEEVVDEEPYYGQGEFSCDLCEMKFKRPYNVKRHKLNVHKLEAENIIEEPWICNSCGNEFNSQKKLINHMREIHENSKEPIMVQIRSRDFTVEMTHHDVSKSSEREFKCDVCQMAFNHAGTLHTHKLRKHPKNPRNWLCDYCGKIFNCRKNRRDHIREVHEKLKLRVKKENPKDLKDEKDFEIEETLEELNEEEPIVPKNHNVEMNDDGDDDLSKSSPSKFNCDVCQKSFNSAGTLHTHKLRKHTENPKKWTCDQCGKEFNCRKNMRDHVREVHEKSKERKECEYCKKSVALSNYVKHVKIQHLGHKPYECNHCDKSYGDRSQLRNHVAVSHKNERFQCDECGLSFTGNQSLRRHIQVQHRGIPLERKHKCDRCEKAFPELPQLKAHIKIEHDKILAFSCEKCAKQFTRKGGLNKHLQSVHGNVRNYQCRFCEKAFTTKNHLGFHEKGVHLKIKDIGCYVCNQMFSRPHHLHNHLDKIHNIEISYLDMKKKLKELNSEKSESVPDSHESSQVEMI